MKTIGAEVTVASEMVYQGSLIDVRRETVRVGEGRTAVREIVQHPPVVAMLPLDARENLLLVRQYRKAIEQVTLEIPAGGIDEGEDAEAAVRREMVEETGFLPGQLEKMATIYPSPGFSDEIMHLFLVQELEGDGRQTEPLDEIETTWVSMGEATEMIRVGEIVDAKSVAGILMLKSRSQHNDKAGPRSEP